MKFLTVVGNILSKVIAVVSGFNFGALFPAGSTAAKDVAAVTDKLEQAASFVMTAEGMFQAAFGPDQKNGAQKLAAATPFVAKLIQSMEILAGKKIKNEDLFTRGCSEITGGLADVLNAYESPAGTLPPSA